MPFWHTPAKQIRNQSKWRSDALEARTDDGDRMPRKQTSPWTNVPSDILYVICDQAFSGTSAYYGVEVLALVCIHWYQIVTGYARLWSVIRIAPHSCKSTVYTTLESYVNTRLKHSHHYPLDVIIHPVSPDWLGTPIFLQKDIKNAIDAVIGEGRHTRRWRTLKAIVHPYLRARLKYPTPILHRVDLDVVKQYETDLALSFPVAPKLRVFSLTGRTASSYYLRLPASTFVTLDNVQLVGFKFYTCISLLERFSKTQRLRTLELTGTWNDNHRRPPLTLPITLPTVRSLILNARGPICVMFSAILLPALVELIVIGSQEPHERKNVLDDRDAFKSVGSRLETLRLESLHFDSEDHLESILLAAPKVKRLTMKGITYEVYKVPVLEDPTSEDPTWSVWGWITSWEAPGESSEPDYVTLLKGPLLFPVLENCIVEDITREDLVLLRRR